MNEVILRSLVRIRLEGMNFSPFPAQLNILYVLSEALIDFEKFLILFFHCTDYSLVYD